jgi:hypothetical protein
MALSSGCRCRTTPAWIGPRSPGYRTILYSDAVWVANSQGVAMAAWPAPILRTTAFRQRPFRTSPPCPLRPSRRASREEPWLPLLAAEPVPATPPPKAPSEQQKKMGEGDGRADRAAQRPAGTAFDPGSRHMKASKARGNLGRVTACFGRNGLASSFPQQGLALPPASAHNSRRYIQARRRRFDGFEKKCSRFVSLEAEHGCTVRPSEG